MIIDNSLIFHKKHFIIVNNVEQKLLYYFDYDERNASENMKFQHFHSYYEIMIALSQNAEHLFEGNLFHLNFGDILLIPPYLLHKSIYSKGPANNRIIINFMYPDDWLKHDLGYSEVLSLFQKKEHIFRFSPEQRFVLFEKLNEIMKYSLSPEYTDSSLNHLMIHTKFVEFLYQLYMLKDQNQYENNISTSSATQKMYSIAAYIHQHFEEPLSLNMLADKFYISPYYLSRRFKDTLHFTVSDYIQITRIKNVQHKLLTTNDKITDIAMGCGFSSFSQFNRTFHKISGVSPREYRLENTDNII